MTRTGKIARLPQAVRRELNLRLSDGAQGRQLVAWLNGLPEVMTVLERDFGGRVITEQNLSEWKQGGFNDWQRHQQTLECVRLAGEQAQELTAEAGPTPLTDVLAASVTLLLTRLIQEAGHAGESTPESRRELVTLIREWTRLRSADQRAARLKMAQTDWVTERNREAEEAARELEEAGRELAAAEEELARVRAYAESPQGQMEAFEKNYKAVDLQVIKETMDIACRENLMKIVCGSVKRGKREWLREQIENQIQERRDTMMAAFKQERGILPDPTESDQIAPEVPPEETVAAKEPRRRRGKASPPPSAGEDGPAERDGEEGCGGS